RLSGGGAKKNPPKTPGFSLNIPKRKITGVAIPLLHKRWIFAGWVRQANGPPSDTAAPPPYLKITFTDGGAKAKDSGWRCPAGPEANKPRSLPRPHWRS